MLTNVKKQWPITVRHVANIYLKLIVSQRRLVNVFLPLGDDFVQHWARYLGELIRWLRNCEDPVLQTAYRTPSISSGVTRNGRPLLRRAHWFGFQWNARTIVWPYWNLAVSGRQYQCRHFHLALCNNYYRRKIETALDYSTYSLSLSLSLSLCAAMDAHSHPTSHTISGRDWNSRFGWTSFFYVLD